MVLRPGRQRTSSGGEKVSWAAAADRGGSGRCGGRRRGLGLALLLCLLLLLLLLLLLAAARGGGTHTQRHTHRDTHTDTHQHTNRGAERGDRAWGRYLEVVRPCGSRIKQSCGGAERAGHSELAWTVRYTRTSSSCTASALAPPPPSSSPSSSSPPSPSPALAALSPWFRNITVLKPALQL